MNTIKDLEEMKNESYGFFGTKYNYFFEALKNYYISKLDGLYRIEAELKNWDAESRKFIVVELANRISESGIMDFDSREILDLA